MYTYVHGGMYTGFVVGGVSHHTYSSIAGRKDLKAGRRLEKREPCSARAGVLWTLRGPVDQSQGWGSSPRTLGKLSKSQTWVSCFSFSQESLESPLGLR